MRNRPHAFTLAALAAAALLTAGCDLGLPAGRTPHREGNRLDMNHVWVHVWPVIDLDHSDIAALQKRQVARARWG